MRFALPFTRQLVKIDVAQFVACGAGGASAEAL